MSNILCCSWGQPTQPTYTTIIIWLRVPKCLYSAENRKLKWFQIWQRTERAGYKKIKRKKGRGGQVKWIWNLTWRFNIEQRTLFSSLSLWTKSSERDEKENEKAWRVEAGGSNGWAAISRLHPRQELGAVVPIEKQPPKNLIFKLLDIN